MGNDSYAANFFESLLRRRVFFRTEDVRLYQALAVLIFQYHPDTRALLCYTTLFGLLIDLQLIF